MDLNHDYKSMVMGRVPELKNLKCDRLKRKGEILIGNDVWIGAGSTIMGGVTIHNGAVVAANSTVTRDVPPYAIVAGNPARVVKYRCSEATIQKLNQICWWNWSPAQLAERSSCFELPFEEFADRFYDKNIES
ncbi:MAG: CatB-related O-acetyltransferase [Lachnospiraceae bacterium]|nr:CatB-related O-acetyltransferase [Lachnospiraceae bacterium]